MAESSAVEVFRATLNFRKIKVALNSLCRIFFNFAKSCILSWLLQFDNNKWGSPSSFLSYKRLKVKLRVFLAGHIVAMVTYGATQLTATCSPMIGQGREVIMTHRTVSLGKYWKLFLATLRYIRFWKRDEKNSTESMGQDPKEWHFGITQGE